MVREAAIVGFSLCHIILSRRLSVENVLVALALFLEYDVEKVQFCLKTLVFYAKVESTDYLLAR